MRASKDDRWADLWDRHADDVYAYARRRVGAEDAPDIVAEVFTVAMTHPERVPEDALPWLYRTAWNLISNHWRAEARRRRPTSELGHAQDPSVDVTERAALLDALLTLSEVDREALLLTAWEGLDATRAAAAAGCSPGTFSVRLHRARARLEAALRAADADEEVAG